MSGNKNAGPLSGLKNLNPKARKGMFIFGGIAIVIILLTLLMLKKNRDGEIPQSVKMAAVPAGGVDATAETTAQYKRLLKEADEKRFAEAESKPGQMVLPKLGGLTNVNTKPEPAGSTTSVQPPPVMQAPVPQQAQQQRNTSDKQQAVYANVLAMMQKIVAKSIDGDSGQLAVINAPQAVSLPVQATIAASSVASTNDALSIASPPAKPFIRMGESFFATLDTAINTDFSGDVIATIHQGKLKGARLKGSKALEQDHVVLKFTLLSPADGSSAVPIDAYAIQIADAKKYGLTGLQGNTDYHVTQRYLLPAAMAFVQAYGAASAQPAQSITQTATGTIQNTPQLSARDRLIVAGGAAGVPLGNDLTRIASRPITQSLDANAEIGIQFSRDVMTLDASMINGLKTQQTNAAPVAPTVSANGYLSSLQPPMQAAQEPTPAAMAQQPATFSNARQPQYGNGTPLQNGYHQQSQYPYTNNAYPNNTAR